MSAMWGGDDGGGSPVRGAKYSALYNSGYHNNMDHSYGGALYGAPTYHPHASQINHYGVAYAQQEEDEDDYYYPSADHQYNSSLPGVEDNALTHSRTSSSYNNNSEHSSETADEYDPAKWRGLDLSHRGLRRISTALGHYAPQLTTLVLANNFLGSLPDELFIHLTALLHLDLSGNELATLPPMIGKVVTLQSLLLGHNQLNELPLEFGRLYRLRTLGLEGNPLQKMAPSVVSSGAANIVRFHRDRLPPPPPPPERSWIPCMEAPVLAAVRENTKLKVITYNVLCESYANPDHYNYCPFWALDWNYRKMRILREIVESDPDVICLQEVEAGHFKKFFEIELGKVGYRGVFTAKSRARTMDDQSALTVDGCAVFYRVSKFTLMEYRAVEYQSSALRKHEPGNNSNNNGSAIGSSELFDRLLSRDNIALIVGLQRQGGVPLVVANTHIHWDPSHTDVKLMQVQILLEEIEDFMHGSRHYANGNVPLLLCGDFNSAPQSGVYELLARGRCGPAHRDLAGRNYGRYSRDGLGHRLGPLASAYSEAPGGEPPFTNLTGDFEGVLDYIWYSKKFFRVTRVLGMVDKAVIRDSLIALPNAYMCSDHVPLVVELTESKAFRE